MVPVETEAWLKLPWLTRQIFHGIRDGLTKGTQRPRRQKSWWRASLALCQNKGTPLGLICAHISNVYNGGVLPGFRRLHTLWEVWLFGKRVSKVEELKSGVPDGGVM